MTIRFFSASILTLAAMCAALTGCPDHTPETGGGGVGGGISPEPDASACPANRATCGAGECLTQIDTDPMNCGGCGIVCSFPHAHAACFAGQCAMEGCDPGWGSCNDAPPGNGCETPIGTDRMNCGTCGEKCSPDETCIAGSCTYCAGCIDAMGQCQPGDSVAACGVMGAACKMCSGGCHLGTCVGT